MSRVGKTPINVPDKVSVNIDANNNVNVEGPKGKLSYVLPQGITLKQEGAVITLERSSEARQVKALHGTAARLINNMVIGVSTGFTRNLEIHGVGFRAAVKGEHIDLNLGYSHPLLHPIPTGLKVTVTDNTKIAVEGSDKQVVGQFCAEIRGYYPPEPYKGKGVRYAGEQIRRKEGKSVK